MKISGRFIIERVVRMVALMELATIATADLLELPIAKVLVMACMVSIFGFFTPMIFEIRWARNGVLPAEWILEQLQPAYFIALYIFNLAFLSHRYGNGYVLIPWAVFFGSILILYVARMRVMQGMSVWGDVVHKGASGLSSSR